MKGDFIEHMRQECDCYEKHMDVIRGLFKVDKNINLKNKVMKEKIFEFWFSKKSFVLLPYIGIRWDYEYELCIMWLCFNLSIVIKIN